eukprot:Rmarinus@m.8291
MATEVSPPPAVLPASLEKEEEISVPGETHAAAIVAPKEGKEGKDAPKKSGREMKHHRGKTSSRPPSSPQCCSVCLETVKETPKRGVATLACGHRFHLDCIGSAFNAKGSMQCPNCRNIEEGMWMYNSGGGDDDDDEDDFPDDLQDGELWCSCTDMCPSSCPCWCHQSEVFWGESPESHIVHGGDADGSEGSSLVFSEADLDTLDGGYGVGDGLYDQSHVHVSIGAPMPAGVDSNLVDNDLNLSDEDAFDPTDDMNGDGLDPYDRYDDYDPYQGVYSNYDEGSHPVSELNLFLLSPPSSLRYYLDEDDHLYRVGNDPYYGYRNVDLGVVPVGVNLGGGAHFIYRRGLRRVVAPVASPPHPQTHSHSHSHSHTHAHPHARAHAHHPSMPRHGPSSLGASSSTQTQARARNQAHYFTPPRYRGAGPRYEGGGGAVPYPRGVPIYDDALHYPAADYEGEGAALAAGFAQGSPPSGSAAATAEGARTRGQGHTQSQPGHHRGSPSPGSRSPPVDPAAVVVGGVSAGGGAGTSGVAVSPNRPPLGSNPQGSPAGRRSAMRLTHGGALRSGPHARQRSGAAGGGSVLSHSVGSGAGMVVAVNPRERERERLERAYGVPSQGAGAAGVLRRLPRSPNRNNASTNGGQQQVTPSRHGAPEVPATGSGASPVRRPRASAANAANANANAARLNIPPTRSSANTSSNPAQGRSAGTSGSPQSRPPVVNEAPTTTASRTEGQTGGGSSEEGSSGPAVAPVDGRAQRDRGRDRERAGRSRGYRCHYCRDPYHRHFASSHALRQHLLINHGIDMDVDPTHAQVASHYHSAGHPAATTHVPGARRPSATNPPMQGVAAAAAAAALVGVNPPADGPERAPVAVRSGNTSAAPHISHPTVTQVAQVAAGNGSGMRLRRACAANVGSVAPTQPAEPVTVAQ